MILLAFAVYDKKVGAYMQPMFFRSKGEACRSFLDACTVESQPFMKHPEDYGFAYLGDFDDSTGSITCPVTGAEFVMTALDAVTQKVS